jgi:hypothetical protein
MVLSYEDPVVRNRFVQAIETERKRLHDGNKGSGLGTWRHQEGPSGIAAEEAAVGRRVGRGINGAVSGKVGAILMFDTNGRH